MLQERTDATLRALNTFGVPAQAARLFEVHSVDDLAELRQRLERTAAAQRPLILGGGSNILFTRDPPQPIVRMAIRGRRILADARGPTGATGNSDTVVVEAGAGERWSEFVDWTLAQGLAGLENLSLIPGTVGASPVQNIGAYGVEMCTRFESLDAVSLRGERRRFDAADCGFGYRDSIFRHPPENGWIIVAVRFRLRRDMPLELDYGELRDELRARDCARPTARDVAQAVAAIRRRKLPDPAVLGNAGSFFRNPVVTARQAHSLIERHPQMPHHAAASPVTRPAAAAPADAVPVKLSAAWLIEQCGWKGFREGDAGVHDRHALILVNHGKATGAQIAALAHRIAGSVQQRFDVRLDPEPLIV